MQSLLEPNELIYSQFEYAFSVIDKCTDDYIFILDLIYDCYSISSSAVKRFPLPAAKFNNVSSVLKNIIHPDDFDMIINNLREIADGKTVDHNFEYRWLNVDGDYVWISCRGKVVFGKDGKPAYLAGRISEIGSRQRADNVTGLLTDVQLNEDYNSYILENGGISGYLMRIRIDNFGELNRRYGKSAGNDILRIVAKITEASLINSARSYRYENSSFVIFDYMGGGIKEATVIYESIRKKVEDAAEDFDYKIFFTVSAGIAEIFPNEALKINEIYKKTEFAVFCAVRKGKNSMVVFDDDEYNKYIRRLDIQENLRKDIKNNFKGFELYYQPIISTNDKKVIGAEALLRWKSDDYGMMSPAEFIPILEESGLIVPVGKWIFCTAIAQCRQWQEFVPNFKMNINISYVQLKTSDVLNDINRCLEETGLDPKYVVIEITESGHLDMDSSIIEGFYNKNFKLAIDDFGTGYSNLRYLQYLKVNLIKIDRSFVEKATNDSYDYKLIKHIIDLAHSIDLEVCLEGIETETEMNTLAPLTPDFIQGFYFGKPVNKNVFFEENIRKC